MATVLGCNLRLTDVHATAETVGREFKELTDKFGMECIKRLVPPVLEALERLEVYVEGYQHLQTRLSRLQMDNDTVEYERAQRTKLAEENENLSVTIRELQREKKHLLMDMDELQFKNKELSAELRSLQTRYTELELVIEDPVLESTPPPPPPPPRPHSPHRVVRLSLSHSIPPGSRSPSFTPSPTHSIPSSPTLSSPNDSTHTSPLSDHVRPERNGSIHSPPSHNHTPHSPPSHNHTAHSPPSHNHTAHSPPSHNHTPRTLHISTSNPIPRCNTSPAVQLYRPLLSIERSSSLSDMAGIRGRRSALATLNQEDMYEKSRVTKRLHVVEEELEMVTRRLRQSQQSQENIVDENRELKTQLERFRAEASLRKIDLSKKELQKAKETPRYYKEEMMRVLTDRNRLKENVVSLQEELDDLREALRDVTVVNGMVDVRGRRRIGTSVRSILRDSVSLDRFIPLSDTQPSPETVASKIKHQRNGWHK